MLDECSRLKKRVEANLSMGHGRFRNRLLLVMFTLGEGSLVLSAHGQDLNLLDLITRCEEMVSGAPSISWECRMSSSQLGPGNNASQHCRLPRFSDNLIEPSRPLVLCSKGDAECSSKLH